MGTGCWALSGGGRPASWRRKLLFSKQRCESGARHNQPPTEAERRKLTLSSERIGERPANTQYSRCLLNRQHLPIGSHKRLAAIEWRSVLFHAFSLPNRLK
jgi:hypothetical protein